MTSIILKFSKLFPIQVKNPLVIVVLCLAYHVSFSQPLLSLRITPSFTYTRVDSNSDSLKFSDNGGGIRMGFGLVADFPLTDHYFFTTGLGYAVKRIDFNIHNSNSGNRSNESYNVRYLEIPLTLKLFTDEMSLDTRIFFQVGIVAEIRVGDKELKNNLPYVKKFCFFDTSLLFAAGVEKKIGTTTAAYIDIGYQRGLINVVKDDVKFDDDLVAKTSMLNIGAGLKF